MILIRRKSDGLYIAKVKIWDGPDGRPGYRHITHTSKPTLALNFRVRQAHPALSLPLDLSRGLEKVERSKGTEETAAKICDFDFDGKPYHPKGYNANIREPEYERVDALDLDQADDHRRKATRAGAGSER